MAGVRRSMNIYRILRGDAGGPFGKGKLSAARAAALLELVEGEDYGVDAVFTVYFQDKDMGALYDGLCERLDAVC